MAKQIRCPHCAEVLLVSQFVPSRKIECPKCGKAFVTPKSKPKLNAASSSAPDPQISDPEGPLGVTKVASMIRLIAFLVAFVLISIYAIILLIRFKRNPDLVISVAGKVGETSPIFLSTAAGLTVAALIVMCIITYVIFVFAMAAWVARDAYSRNHCGLGWTCFYLISHFVAWFGSLPLIFLFGIGFLTFALGWIGFLIYLGGRRQGLLKLCDNCYNKRLVYATVCPHCGIRIQQRDAHDMHQVTPALP